MSNTLIVNMFAGPGCGKSTTAANLFAELKHRNINCELASEWAKEKVWGGEEISLNNQIYVFGKQFHRIWRLLNKVEVVITDSPLLMSILYYEGTNPYFTQMVLEEHRRLNNLNIMLARVKPYNPSGRLQTEDKARILDTKIAGILREADEEVHVIPADREAASLIVEIMEGKGLLSPVR